MQLVSGTSSHLKLPRSGVLCVAAGEEGLDGCLAPDGGRVGMSRLGDDNSEDSRAVHGGWGGLP